MRLLWWGDNGIGTLFRPYVCAAQEHDHTAPIQQPRSLEDEQMNISHNTVCYSIHSASLSFSRYLRDAHHLILQFYHFADMDQEQIRRETRKSSLRSAWTTRKPQKQKQPIGK